jgi:hypothetical protein
MTGFSTAPIRNRHEKNSCKNSNSPAVKDPPKKKKTKASAVREDSEESDTDSIDNKVATEPVQSKQNEIERMVEVFQPTQQEDASGSPKPVLSGTSDGDNHSSAFSASNADLIVIDLDTIDQKMPSSTLPAIVPKPVQLKPYVAPIAETVGSDMVSNRYAHETMKYCNELVAIARSVDSSQDVNASISKYIFDSHFNQHQIVMIVDFLSDLMSRENIRYATQKTKIDDYYNAFTFTPEQTEMLTLYLSKLNMSPSNTDIEIKFIGKYQKYINLAKVHRLVSNTNYKMNMEIIIDRLKKVSFASDGKVTLSSAQVLKVVH